MIRKLAFVVGYAVFQLLATTAWAAEYGTAEEAKAMLERAVAAVKEDKAKALDMFNNGEGGFKDRDLYVWCANASDGIITAQPYMNKGNPPCFGVLPFGFSVASSCNFFTALFGPLVSPLRGLGVAVWVASQPQTLRFPGKSNGLLNR